MVDHDGGAIAAGFVDVLHSDQLHDVLSAKSFPDEAAASRALKDGDVRAVFVLPAGMSAAMTGNAAVDIRVLTSVDYQLAGQVATSIATSFVAQLQADRLSVATALVAGAPGDQLAALAEKAATLRLPASVVIGMLGGCMWPLEIVPSFMRTLGHFFPHAWAVDAWTVLLSRGGDLGAIAGQLAILAGFAAVLLSAATVRLRHSISD